MDNLDDIMSINVDNLKQKQLAALKAHVLAKLSQIHILIGQNKFNEVKEYLIHSPAGDGYGDDNYYINFGWELNSNLDLCEVLEKMEGLSK